MTALPNPGWKRCLSFFYCIILPFDLVTLKRMSYNVESAKSVLFYQVCNLFKNNVKDFLCNIHITKITKMLYMVSRCHCLTNDYYVLWQYYDTLQLFGRCYGWHPLWYPIFICFCACFSYVICFLFLFLRTLYAICTTNATDRHLLYAPWDTDALSSVQMIATTCVVALWLISIEWLSNHTNLRIICFTKW